MRVYQAVGQVAVKSQLFDRINPCLFSFPQKISSQLKMLCFISKPGTLQSRNSRTLYNPHWYFLRKKRQRAMQERPFPLKECTRQLSAFAAACSIKLKIWLAIKSDLSVNRVVSDSSQQKFRYLMPQVSKWLGISLEEQLIMWVVCVQTMVSRHLAANQSPMQRPSLSLIGPISSLSLFIQNFQDNRLMIPNLLTTICSCQILNRCCLI